MNSRFQSSRVHLEEPCLPPARAWAQATSDVVTSRPRRAAAPRLPGPRTPAPSLRPRPPPQRRRASPRSEVRGPSPSKPQQPQQPQQQRGGQKQERGGERPARLLLIGALFAHANSPGPLHTCSVARASAARLSATSGASQPPSSAARVLGISLPNQKNAGWGWPSPRLSIKRRSL